LSEEQSLALEQLHARHVETFTVFVDNSKHVVADLNRKLSDAETSARQLVTALGRAELEFAIHPDKGPDGVRQAAKKALVANTQLLDVKIVRETTFAEIADAQSALDQQFFSEFEGLLTKDQLEKMPRVQSELRRRAWLGKTGVYSEEGVDLIRLVETIAMTCSQEPESDQLQEVLQNYADQIIVPLTELAETAIRESRRYYRDHYEAEHLIPGEKGISLDYNRDIQHVTELKRKIARIHRLHRAIRDFNRDYKPVIEALLPEEVRSRFHEAYMDRALRSHVNVCAMPAKSFALEVLAIESLSPQQLRDMNELVAAHYASVTMSQMRILHAADAVSEVQLDTKADPSRRAEAQAKLDSSLDSYRQVEVDFMNVVWDLLTTDQQALIVRPTLERLPK